jgi:acetyl-CoA carboxylase biotin carboxyl carrier protein
VLNIKEIKDMITLMNDNQLSELEVEKEGMKLKLKKGFGGIERSVEYVQHHAPAPQAPAKAAPAVAEKAKPAGTEIKAPMVGTFYRSPSPDAASYVNIGDKIEVGQVLCIIEAMKLMNEIKSEVRGKIVDIQAENAEPIEFGQVLFVVEPI